MLAGAPAALIRVSHTALLTPHMLYIATVVPVAHLNFGVLKRTSSFQQHPGSG